MRLLTSPKGWIVIAAIVGLVLGGLRGALLGGVGGLVLALVFGVFLNVVSGGAIPRGVRRALVTNVLTDAPGAARRAFPGLDGNELFSAVESEVERIIRKAVSVSPSHEAIYSDMVVMKAAVIVTTEEPDPARKELLQEIAHRLGRDWYHHDACQNCGSTAHLARVTITDGSPIWLCPRCRREAENVFSDPLQDFEFGKVVEAMSFTPTSAWGIPWGASRNQILAQIPAEYRDVFASSRSAALMRNEAVALAGRTVFVTFLLDDSGALKEVQIAPKQAVLDAITPLQQRLGRPSRRALGFAPGELRIIWNHDGLEFDLSYPPNQVVSLAVRRERRW